MKKLSLKANSMNKGEVLTRAQLKNVMGGSAAPTTGCPSGKAICICSGSSIGCKTPTDCLFDCGIS